MNTPEKEIPASMMVAAREAAAKAWEAAPDGMSDTFAENSRAGIRDGALEIQAAALAILAERERCLKACADIARASGADSIYAATAIVTADNIASIIAGYPVSHGK